MIGTPFLYSRAMPRIHRAARWAHSPGVSRTRSDELPTWGNAEHQIVGRPLIGEVEAIGARAVAKSQ